MAERKPSVARSVDLSGSSDDGSYSESEFEGEPASQCNLFASLLQPAGSESSDRRGRRVRTNGSATSATTSDTGSLLSSRMASGISDASPAAETVSAGGKLAEAGCPVYHLGGRASTRIRGIEYDSIIYQVFKVINFESIEQCGNRRQNSSVMLGRISSKG